MRARPAVGRRLVAAAVAATLLGWGLARPAAAAAPVTSIWSTPEPASRPGDPVVALTFDDGPDARWTPQVLSVLRRYGVPATFFVTGASAAARPDLVRAMAAEGHSVQNHTWSHVNLTTLPLGQYPHQIDDTTRVIERETGQPVRCARPPYGYTNSGVVDRLAARGLTSVGWSVDTSDYQRPGAGAIAGRVLSAARPGGIVLLHDGGGDRSQTVAALPTIIEGLRARGLRFTSLCAPRTTRYVDLLPAPGGYWLARSDGRVDARGGAPPLGGTAGPARPVTGGAASPSGAGYWTTTADGAVSSFGDARFAGTLGGLRLGSPIVAMAPSRTGRGYWLAAADGGVFSFGDARFAGSLGGMRLDSPIVAMAASRTGRGYWLVAADGGVFSFGDAWFEGSLGGVRLHSPIVGMARTRIGRGYWLVAADGGVFAFGDAGFAGSRGGAQLDAPITRMAATSTGRGYWLLGADGGVFTFGDAPFFGAGSLG